eukprot:4697769-Amphidinium_carterae.1
MVPGGVLKCLTNLLWVCVHMFFKTLRRTTKTLDSILIAKAFSYYKFYSSVYSSVPSVPSRYVT